MSAEKQMVAQPVETAAGIVAVIERAAMNPDVDIEKMERLLAMQERIFARNAEMAFNSAMAQMQAELPVIAKTGEIKHNGKLISTYARFEDINEAVKPILQRHGFAVSFKTDTADGKVKITGILTHREGHRETTDMVLPVDTSGAKNAVQAIGSSTQYGKRYVMCALLNISTGEDDDGNGTTADTITDEQVANLQALITETASDKAAFLRFMGVTRLDEIGAKHYNRAVKALEQKRKGVK